MILEVKRLTALKRYVGEFQERYAPFADKLVLPLAEVEGDISVAGSYEIYEDDSVAIDLTLSYKLRGRCSYCLEDAEKTVEFSYEALFVPDGGDGEDYNYNGMRLDILPAVQDAFVFSQPQVLLCGACQSQQQSKN